MLKRLSPVTRFLILTDIGAYGAAGLLTPIFAIFVTDFIEGGGAEVVGIAAAIYLFSKGIAQILSGLFIDKIIGDKDDYWLLIGGVLFVHLIPLAYLVISTPTELYLVQCAMGIAVGCTFPAFNALFTRYAEQGREGISWGVYYTGIDLAQAGAAALGGLIAVTLGFEKVIYAVVLVGLLSMLFYIPIAPALRTGRG